MRKERVVLFSIIGAIVCSVLCIGYSTKHNTITTINNQETTEAFNIPTRTSEVNEAVDYWENTPMEEIRTSILGYIDDMMNLTIDKLEDFKRENNESKIKLYENEVKRLNTILKNINLAKTKEDLREAMQVRHKSSI